MGILSDILDPIFSSDTSEQDATAKANLKKARDEWNIQAPDLSISDPSKLVDLGGYNPDLINAQSVNAPDKVSYDLSDPRLASVINQDNSQMNDIQTDPRLRSNQQDAISALNELAKSGGFNATDLANLSRNHSQVVQDDRARRDAISQSMGARGMSSSGMDLLSKLQSAQAATDRESQYGLDVAGQGQDRALNAIIQSGNLSGQMQNQDFNQAAQKAAAQDAINRFNATNINSNSEFNANAANQNAVNRAAGRLSAANINASNQMSVDTANANRNLTASEANQGAANAANQYNSSNAQRISDSNTQNKNIAQSLRDNLPQQNFNNLSQLASGKANADVGMANSYQNDANRIAQKDANYLGALIQGGAAAAGAPSKKDGTGTGTK